MSEGVESKLALKGSEQQKAGGKLTHPADRLSCEARESQLVNWAV